MHAPPHGHHHHHHEDQPNPQPEPTSPKPLDMSEDQRLFKRTVLAFNQYEVQARTALIIRQQNFQRLPDHHKKLLASSGISIDAIMNAYHLGISNNQAFFNDICEASDELFCSYWPEVDPDTVPHEEPSAMDYDKVFSTVRQFVRDWSDEGAAERAAVYGNIIRVLEKQFPIREDRAKVRVLVPGAGLCRLSVEVALMGFFCQANEFSYHMLIGGHFIQNHIDRARQYVITPNVDNTCNLANRQDQFASAHIPDLCTMEAVEALCSSGKNFGELSMVAGDFTEVYRKPEHAEQWDVVASCFFLDTAHNILEYLEVIYHILPKGGLLINIGPLLYHFADGNSGSSPGQSADGVTSIELALNELLAAAQHMGFALIEGPSFVDTTYTNNTRSMKQLVYRAAFFVLQKV